MGETILYMSVTGVLSPLGYSQVLRPLRALAALGWRYELVTCERASDLADRARVSALESELASEGISWTCSTYASPPENLAALTRGAWHASRRGTSLTHARSYQSGVVALLMRKLSGTPYVFDKRGYWIDEKRDEGLWFTYPAAYAAGKRVERALFEGSSAVVSLTRHGVEDVESGVFGRWPSSRPVLNIPTCVDYDTFSLDADDSILPDGVRARLRGKLVIGYIGSLNASYKVDSMCALFARVRALQPRAHLLALTGQPDALASRLEAQGVDVDADVTLARAPHCDMPAWLAHVDWGLMLLNSTYAKRASMPTKLAEFFAAGVRPVQLGCNDDVSDWVERASTGVSLHDDSPRELDRAARLIADSTPRASGDADLLGSLARAREVTMPHFSLRQGVLRYDRLYHDLIGARD